MDSTRPKKTEPIKLKQRKTNLMFVYPIQAVYTDPTDKHKRATSQTHFILTSIILIPLHEAKPIILINLNSPQTIINNSSSPNTLSNPKLITIKPIHHKGIKYQKEKRPINE